MPKDSVIIKIDGKVSIGDFRTVVDAFVDLMMALTAETNADAPVDWLISDLKPGSAQMTTRGFFGNLEGERTVEAVIAKYEYVATSAAEGRIDRFSDRVRDSMRAITSVINGQIPQVLMGTPDDPIVARLSRPIPADFKEEVATKSIPYEPRQNSRGAVKGQIVTLDDKHGTYFTLQEAYGQRNIRCYPGKEHREKLGTYWEQRTWVIVEGTYTRFATGPTLTQITDIVPLPNREKGSWRQAIGIAPRGPDGLTISSAEAVRRVRDAEA